MTMMTGAINTENLPPEAKRTVDFSLFKDKLFDCVNDLSINVKHGKLLKREYLFRATLGIARNIIK